MSRHHARLLHNGVEWRLDDLGSSNGTFVDGRLVRSISVDRPMLVDLGPPGAGSRMWVEPFWPTGSTGSGGPPSLSGDRAAASFPVLLLLVLGLLLVAAGMFVLDWYRVELSAPGGLAASAGARLQLGGYVRVFGAVLVGLGEGLLAIPRRSRPAR